MHFMIDPIKLFAKEYKFGLHSNNGNKDIRGRGGNKTTYILCTVDVTGPSRSSLASLATLFDF